MSPAKEGLHQFLLSLLLNVVLLSGVTLGADADGGKCLVCEFLAETFNEGLKRTANKHFAGGDTAWEEKNLGKYSTSETRLIEVLEGVCKKSTLSNTDRFLSVKELEFKCSHLLEEHEESVETWYYKHQSDDLAQYLCVHELSRCCPKAHFGKTCKQCPGVAEGAEACFGHGSCDGNRLRVGTGKCSCDRGYVGLLCRQCDANFYAKEKSETSIECEECFSGCAGGCTGPSASECNECKAGYARDENNACQDVDECSSADLQPCTGANEKCHNTVGSYTCECVDGFVRNEVTKECEIDIHASVPAPLIRPDLLLKLIAFLGLFGCVVLVFSRPSALLVVLLLLAILFFIGIELYVNPDAVPDQVKKHFEL